MRELLCTVATLLCLCGSATAQALPEKSKDTIAYFNAEQHELPSEAGAVERIEIMHRDSISGTVRVFFMPSGKLKGTAAYANLRRRIREGTTKEYYENGQLRFQASYVADQYVGEFVSYYPNGTLKRRDQYVPHQPTTGECFGPNGNPVPYFSYEQMPLYSEGAGDNAALVHAVMLNTRYPALALRNQLSAVIKVSFVVGTNGQVQNVRTVDSEESTMPKKAVNAYKALQESAMNAVRQLKSFVPGRQDDKPVAVSFTVPVTFSIQ